MKKLVLILMFSVVLLYATTAFSATYYVSQAGTGDGTTISTPDSVSDANGGVFGELDDDTVYYIGAITSQINIPDSGTSGHMATYRGDYPGQPCTIDTSDNYGVLINNKSYVVVRGFTITGAVVNGINYYVNTANSTDVSIIGNSVDGNSRTEISASGIQVLAAGYNITNLVLKDNSSSDTAGTGIMVYGTGGGVFSNWEIHDNQTSGNTQHGHAFSDVGTNTQEIYNLTSTGDGNDTPLGWMGIAITAIKNNSTGFANYSGNIYYDDITGYTAYYVINNTDSTILTHNNGNYATLGVNEWDQEGVNLYFNIGGDPTGKTLHYAKGQAENITIRNCVVSATIDGSGADGHGFSFDGFASNNVAKNMYSYSNAGSGFASNIGHDNIFQNCLSVGNAKFGFVFLKFSEGTKHKIYNCTASGNSTSGIRTSSAMVVLDAYNNISVNNTQYGGSGATGSTVTSDYNLFYGNGSGAVQLAWSAGANTLTSDPLLTSNYKLTNVSPAVDAGVLLDIHVAGWKDLSGKGRLYGTGVDMGAYEKWQGSYVFLNDFALPVAKAASWYSAP